MSGDDDEEPRAGAAEDGFYFGAEGAAGEAGQVGESVENRLQAGRPSVEAAAGASEGEIVGEPTAGRFPVAGDERIERLLDRIDVEGRVQRGLLSMARRDADRYICSDVQSCAATGVGLIDAAVTCVHRRNEGGRKHENEALQDAP